jgi:hypothetical protein
MASGREPDLIAKLIAFHGSTTPAEMAVPLMIVRGDR